MKKLIFILTVAVMLTQTSPTEPATLEVVPPGGVVVLGDVFTSIQQAIDNASNGDTIVIHPGTYDEALNIEGFTGLTLTGTDKTTVIVKSSTTLPWNVGGYGTSRQTVIRIVGSTGVVVQSMTLDCDLIKGNSKFGITGWDSAVTVDNCIIKNMSVDDLSGGYYELASYFRTETYTDVSRADITFTDNEFINAGRVGIVTHDYINATITGNTFYKTLDDFGYAVEVGSESIGSVTGNTIYGYDTPAASDGSESAGIYIESAFTGRLFGTPVSVVKPVTVQNNEVYDCQYAMWIGNGYDGYAGDVDIQITVADNNFHNNVDGAVILQDEDAEDGSSVTATFQGNTITDNNSVGYYIFTQGDGDITATFNDETIADNNIGIIVEDFAEGPSASSYSVQVRDSNLADNSDYGVDNEVNSIVVDAINNCWGDATGPYHPVTNPTGLGSGVSDDVDYYPWYLDCTSSTPVYKPVHNVTLDAYYDNIKPAVVAANGGDLITVDPGTYVEDGQIFVDKDLIIKGIGGSKPVVKTNADTGSSGDPRGWWLVDTGVTLDLENLVLDGTGYLVYQGVRHKGLGTFESVDFKNIKFNESGPTYGGVAVAAFGGGPVDFNSCTFEEIGRVGVLYWVSGVFSNNTYTGKGPGDWLDYCLDIDTGAVVDVTGNTITDCNGIASSDGSTSAGILVTTYYGAGTQSTITNNTLTRNSAGIAVGYDEADTSVATITCNQIAGNYEFGVVDSNCPSATIDAQKNWWGDASGPSGAGGGSGDAVSDNVDFFPWLLSTDCGDFTLIAPDYVVDDDWDGLPDYATVNVGGTDYYIGLNAFAVIQDAIDAASDGNSISVADGNYPENLVINKSLTIVGAGGETSTIESATGLVLVSINTAATSVEFSYFTLKHTGTDNWSSSYAILIENGAYANIHDNVVDDFKKRGIYVQGTDSSADITDNTVIGNGGVDGLQNGIVVWNSGGGFTNIINNEVSGGSYTGEDWSGSGIMTLDSYDKVVRIKQNYVHNNEMGIAAGDYCEYNPGSYADDVVIQANLVVDNQYGIDIFNDIRGVLVLGNEITGSSEYGVGVSDYTDSGWEDCVPPSDTLIQYNSIVDNNVGLWAIERVSPVNAEYNFWGNISGPNDPNGTTETNGLLCYNVDVMKNADGLGDDVSEYVDYCPWLAAPVITSAGPCPVGDLDGDCDVDFNDLAILGNNWLVGTEP